MPAGLTLCAGPHCIWQKEGVGGLVQQQDPFGLATGGQDTRGSLQGYFMFPWLCVCACTLAQASCTPWTETGLRPLPLPHSSPLRGLLVSSVEWKNPTPAHDSLGSPAQAVGLERNSHVFHCAKAGLAQMEQRGQGTHHCLSQQSEP